MFHYRTFRNFPEVFDDRGGGRYLTPPEAAELAGIKGPATRAPWLLVRLTAKGLVQQYLSERYDLWIPENSLGVRGGLPHAGQCARFVIEPDGPYESKVPELVLRAVVGETGVLCAVEPAKPDRRFSIAIQGIDTGFPFFLDDPFSEDEVSRLSAVEDECRNSHVAASLAVKRATIDALGLTDGADDIDESDFVIGPIEYAASVPVHAPACRTGGRQLFAWVDILPPLTVAYAVALDPGVEIDETLTRECEWIVDPRGNGRQIAL